MSNIQFPDAISITTFGFLERPSSCLSNSGELLHGRRGDEKTKQMVLYIVLWFRMWEETVLASGHDHKFLAVFISWLTSLVIFKTKAE